MRLMKADFDRRLTLPGVPEPVQRPVDIDRTRTGFVNLRSLRIYRFVAQSVIDGHAEEDEVLIIVMHGSVDLAMSEGNSLEGQRPVTLTAVGEGTSHACAAYLPPNGAYKLIPRTDAEIAYARATPNGGGSMPKAFVSAPRQSGSATVVLEELTHAKRLRMRVLKVDAAKERSVFSPLKPSEANSEALIHVRLTPDVLAATIQKAGVAPDPRQAVPGESISLESWDTVAVAAGDRPIMHFPKGMSAVMLAVLVG